ncbi:hypothetical protein JMJ56_31630 [Belnapia sp. T18]|uniref:Uncharacterized protein n=1 Tax=Belnapia arida TaxID=2804533 RepID=A0ABS1UCU6_9PROT|nr:hypothetical protein [Belnapia arida]MBL6082519.1 hypothetical protein [Belnapia arida]
MAETLLQPGWREAMRWIDGIDLHIVEAALAAVEQEIGKTLQTARKPEVT